MFVSIVRNPLDGESQRRTSVYQCDRYHILPVKSKRTEFMVTVEGHNIVHFTYDTTETGLGVYAMNDLGQTIDTIFRSSAD